MISSTLAAAWSAAVVALPIPDPPAAVPPGFDVFSTIILGWGKWIVIALGVGSLLYSGGMLVLGGRNRHQLAAEGLTRAAWTGGGLILAGSAAVIVDLFVP